MLIKTERPLEATENPTPTAAKRLGRFMAGVDESRYKAKDHPSTLVYPGLDMNRLRMLYGPQTAGMPRRQRATFRVPLGITPTHYERLRNQRVTQWLNEMGRAGFELRPWPGQTVPIRVYPGLYPAMDLATGYPILDSREFIAEAYFALRKPKIITLEIERAVIDPLVVNA